jgi:hypothetical protein
MSHCLLSHSSIRQGVARRTSAAVLRFSGMALLFLIFWPGSTGFAAVNTEKDAVQSCGFTDDGFDPTTDVHAIEEYEYAIAGLLKQKKFAKLDCIANSVRTSKARFSGGTWKLHKFYAGLEEPKPGHPTEVDWRNHLAHLNEWVAARPASITARVALAESYISYGWDARGTGYSDTISDSGVKLFDLRIRKAKTILDSAATLHNKCPEWYVAMQQVAQGQNWDLLRSTALLEKAASIEPGYFYYYRAQATLLLPQWMGKEGKPARFAEQAADRMGGKAGDMLYFEIAQAIVCGCDEPESVHFSWPRLQQGYAAIEQQYGPSLNELNWLALMAFKFNDSVAADAAFKRIGDNWDKEAWRTEAWFKQNRDWALQFAAMEARSRAIKQEARANLQTVEGTSYKKTFDMTFAPIERSCVQKAGNDLGKFEFLVEIGNDGIAQDAWMTRPSAVATCLMQELGASHAKKEKLFPVPPHDAYWIVLDLDPATFNTAAK